MTFTYYVVFDDGTIRGTNSLTLADELSNESTIITAVIDARTGTVLQPAGVPDVIITAL
jgi:hypothetical protein